MLGKLNLFCVCVTLASAINPIKAKAYRPSTPHPEANQEPEVSFGADNLEELFEDLDGHELNVIIRDFERLRRAFWSYVQSRAEQEDLPATRLGEMIEESLEDVLEYQGTHADF